MTECTLDLVRLSRTVAHALRHEPGVYGLELDPEGWVAVADLLAALRRRRREWRDLSEQDLSRMIGSSSKRRYELRGGRLRALYGHSLEQPLQRRPVQPPELLYHGTEPETVDAIRRDGLKPMARQHVHLSADRAGAVEVGRRRSDHPVVLRILSGRAHTEGIRFYEGSEEVWLADEVPPRFIAPGEV